MKVYRLLPADDSELCHPDDWKSFDSGIAARERIEWKPLHVRVIHFDDGKRLQRSDTPWWTSHVLILRPKAVELLGPFLRENGELLELACDEDTLVAFKATRVVDALSKESDVARFDDGSISVIFKHVFRPEGLRDVEVFKIPDIDVSPIFVTDRFVRRWRATGLTGLVFMEIWSETRGH